MSKLSEEEIQAMINGAMVDCYNANEEFMGILYTLQSEMTFPFKAKALGEVVDVIGIDDGNSNTGRGIVAEVKKQGKIYTIGLGELEGISPNSENSKWFQMFHYWASRY